MTDITTYLCIKRLSTGVVEWEEGQLGHRATTVNTHTFFFKFFISVLDCKVNLTLAGEGSVPNAFTFMSLLHMTALETPDQNMNPFLIIIFLVFFFLSLPRMQSHLNLSQTRPLSQQVTVLHVRIHYVFCILSWWTIICGYRRSVRLTTVTINCNNTRVCLYF